MEFFESGARSKLPHIPFICPVNKYTLDEPWKSEYCLNPSSYLQSYCLRRAGSLISPQNMPTSNPTSSPAPKLPPPLTPSTLPPPLLSLLISQPKRRSFSNPSRCSGTRRSTFSDDRSSRSRRVRNTSATEQLFEGASTRRS